MMKGLGHLIRTMFGGKKPAPALPSRMVGTVECDSVKAPIASDDVLRRAMGAAAGDAAAAEEASKRIYRHKEDEAAEVQTLPTLFLHGKPVDEEAGEVSQAESVADDLPREAVVDAAPVEPVAEADVEEMQEPEEPSLGATGLLASMSRVEIDGPTEPAADILLARANDIAEADAALDLVAGEPMAEVAEVVSIVAGEEQGVEPVALVIEAAGEPGILSVVPEPNYDDARPDAIEALFEADAAPAAAEAVELAVETVAGLVAAADADLIEVPEAPVEDMPEVAVAASVEEVEPAGTAEPEAQVEPAESLASLADTMDEVVTQVGARAAARGPAKKPASPRKKADPSTKRKKGKALPEDAVWLTDALIWSQCGSWREFWLPPTDAGSSQRLEEFRAHAAAGALKVWAKADGSDEWVVVTASHWKKAGFDPLAFLAGRENAFSQAPAPKTRSKKADAAPPKEPVKYGHLMVSKAEVEALFGTAADGDTAAVA